MNSVLSRTILNKRSISRTFAALKHYNFRVWFIGQLVSLVGTWMQSTAQGYLIYDLTRSAAMLGLVGFAAYIPVFFFSLYGGLIADRILKKTLLLITQASMMILAFILTGLVYFNLIQAWHIVILAFLLGIANAFDAPARHSFVVEMVDHQDLSNAIALNSMIFNAATFVGPAVAGITYAALGPAWCFAINGFSFIAVIFALLMMRVKPLLILSITNKNVLAQIKDGLRYVRGHSITFYLLSSLSVIALFGFSLTNLIPLWAVSVLGGDVRTNGLLISARGLGSLMGALTLAIYGHYRIKGSVWTIGSLAAPLALVIFAFTRWLPLSLAMMAIMGWGIMVMANISNALVQSFVSDEMRGRVMGIYTVVFMGSMPFGSLIIGGLASLVSPTTTVLICAAAIFSYAFFIWTKHPEIRKLE